MTAPVTHINLLQRSAPAHTMALALAALLTVTMLGTLVYGSQVRSQAQEAVRRRDEVAQQLKAVQERLAIQSGAKAMSAAAEALRKEADALRPKAQAAQALIDEVRKVEGGRTDEFARPLVAVTGLNESGLWLTSLVVSAGGNRLEMQGEARNGASVLRFARRANESLQPLRLRLDSLELQPAAAGAASDASTGAVSFRLH